MQALAATSSLLIYSARTSASEIRQQVWTNFSIHRNTATQACRPQLQSRRIFTAAAAITSKNTVASLRNKGRMMSSSAPRPRESNYPKASEEDRTPDTNPSSSKPPPPQPQPSASIILLSPTNQVLLLQRVRTSSSFASAHVFPGGNLSEFHDGSIPAPGDGLRRHVDSPAYRMAAIRETFEESGILLARSKGAKGEGKDKSKKGKGKDGKGKSDGKGEGKDVLLDLPAAQRDAARNAIHENRFKFGDWVDFVGGIPDTENLLPFTRWITPVGPAKRFTTQMYIYMLPLEEDASASAMAQGGEAAVVPSPDPEADGKEVTTARFDDAAAWLAKQGREEIVLFPPQFFLLHLLSGFLKGPPSSSSPVGMAEHYAAQRAALRTFLETMPTSTHPAAVTHPTSQIPWADKCISPVVLGARHSDRRTILGLDRPGREISSGKANHGRGGDFERVMLIRFGKGPMNLEVRGREEVLKEEEEAKRVEEEKGREKEKGAGGKGEEKEEEGEEKKWKEKISSRL
ncbi:hypothetical protein F4777DRAFT_321030 [Nemania sp. FL0916]|nr:hypothetical protein F4777DRAFT_321030 [Nemania sp. FL0916]